MLGAIMMISLLTSGQYLAFGLLLVTLIISLTFHEFGHAWVAKLQGDNTAEMMGRLTLNPVAHIDPMGLLMVMFLGFGYAKPVPTNPRNFRSKSSDLWIALAGPMMNLMLAIVAWNFFMLGRGLGWESFSSDQIQTFFWYLTNINLLLMVFNLIPLGPLDGHYILPHFLPDGIAATYRQLNAQYGNYLFMGLILLSIAGLPIFKHVLQISRSLIPLITFIR